MLAKRFIINEAGQQYITLTDDIINVTQDKYKNITTRRENSTAR